MAKASDFGRNDRTFFVRTHLGHLLHAGDNALGYDMSTSNMVNPDLEAAAEKGFTVPDVILVLLQHLLAWPLSSAGGCNLKAFCDC